MTGDSSLATIILVHGAWVDGSSWSRVILSLSGRGYTVVAAPLPLTSLKDDIFALQGVIDRTTGSVVLVGHAYAGAVISGVRGDRIRSLVFIAGLAPAEGQSVGEVFFMNPPHAEAPTLEPAADGRFWLPEEAFAKAFAQRADAKMLTVLAAVQRPIHAQAIQETADAALWRSVPSWYLVASEDRMIPTETQRSVAHRMGASLHELSVDHCPMITAPDEVEKVILAAV